MPRLCVLVLLAALSAAALLPGCGKKSGHHGDAKPAEQSGRPQLAVGDPASPGTAGNETSPASFQLPPGVAELTPRERHDAALLDALNHLAERRYTEALTALKVAQTAEDSAEVRQQIARVKAQMAQQTAALQTAQDIQSVMQQGNPEEAARLASTSLQQYGATDNAPRLLQLKQEADALRLVSVDDTAVRRARLSSEGEAALRENNLRAAALAYEQALQYGDDANLRRQLDEVRGALARYDDNRRRAAQLRRNPADLEDALAALQEAARAWDTLQVRQDIEDYTLALQKRRETVSVADFEVRGNVGIPVAGRTVAEELLPAFRCRFDVIERAQLTRVVEELRLETSDLVGNDASRREVGRLARVRYLVLGSISPLGGITVNARLVDVRSGLVVQTAKVVARTPEEVVPLLPQLAQLLMMNDEQKIAFEHQLGQRAPLHVIQATNGPLPPPPPVPVASALLPPPVVVYSPRPPDFGGLRPQDFAAPPPAVVVVEREEPVKRRLLSVAVELGDNLFRRGRYDEANAQFQLAINLAPGEVDLRLRIDRCRPHLPPPPPVVVVPVAPPCRPRIAVFSFVVNARPTYAPPGFGDWAAEQIACHFTPTYEVIDRGELFWYMGRLGFTVRDVACDPVARRYLARALNVRFFVFGVVEQTASFNVTTHLVDAESGARQGQGSIHVQDQQELKLRIRELAQQIHHEPAQRDQFQRETLDSERQVNEARRLLKEGKAAQAAEVCRAGLQRRPDNIGLQALLQQAERQTQQAALEEQRRREAERQREQAAAIRQKQEELTRAATAARLQAEKEASAATAAARRQQERQRDQAYQDLHTKAQTALAQKNYPEGIRLLESAVAVKPSDAGQRELAEARSQAQAVAQARVAEEQARRAAEERQKKEAELAQVQARLAAERKQKEAEEQARRKAQEDRDQTAYTKLLDEARQHLAQQKYDAAQSALQSARQIRTTDEVNQLLGQARDRQAKAEAEKKGAQARAEQERRLADEQAARAQAEAKAKQNQEQYTRTLEQAQQALAARRYDDAIAQYNEAGKLFKTDVVLNGLRAAQEAKARDKAQAEADEKKRTETALRQAELLRLRGKAKGHLEAKEFDKAVQTLTEAKKLAPESTEVAAELSRVEEARNASAAQARREKEEQQKDARFRKFLQVGRANLAAKQYEAATAAFNEALKMKPADAEAKAALQDAEKAQDAAEELARREAEAKKKADDARKLVRDGRQALNTGKIDAAIGAARKALELVPGERTASELLAEAEKKKAEPAAKEKPTSPQQVQELRKQAEFRGLMAQGDRAAAEKRYDEAIKVYREALQVVPGDPTATKALAAAKQALETARAPKPAPAKPQGAAEPAKLPPEYAKQLQAAAALGKQQKFAESARAYRSAARAVADDPQAQNAEDFARNMADGMAALAARRGAEAEREFAEALKLMPGDADAAAALKLARAAKP